jgi:hypothetical protein
MLLVNRTAVVVTAKQPFLHWLQSVDPTSHDMTLDNLNEDPSIYLLPDSDSEEKAAKYLRKFCQEILTEELDGWWRDPSVWPKDLNFRLFTRWFEWRYHSIVYDLAKGALIREEA